MDSLRSPFARNYYDRSYSGNRLPVDGAYPRYDHNLRPAGRRTQKP